MQYFLPDLLFRDAATSRMDHVGAMQIAAEAGVVVNHEERRRYQAEFPF